MKPEHELHLRTTYPLLYAEPFLQCGGYFQCDDGWFNLIDKTSAELEKLIAAEPKESQSRYRAVQVKEKFSQLRLYLLRGTKEMYDVAQRTEDESAKVCELCGEPGSQKSRKCLVKTLCEPCFDEWRNK